MKYPTPEADAFANLCRGVGVRPDDAVPIIKKLEIKLAQKRQAHDVTRHALKLKSAECIREAKAIASIMSPEVKEAIEWAIDALEAYMNECSGHMNYLRCIPGKNDEIQEMSLTENIHIRIKNTLRDLLSVLNGSTDRHQNPVLNYKCSECDYWGPSVENVLIHKTLAH